MLLNLLANDCTWEFQFNVSVMRIPRNFISAVYFRFTLFKLTCSFIKNFDCLLWNDIIPDLPTFIIRSFLLNQFYNSIITLRVFLWSAHKSISIISTLMSSANMTRFAPWIFKGRSFMYNKNNSGPSTEPGGTPYLITLQEDLYLLTLTFLESLWFISVHCLLFLKYDLNHKFVVSLIPLNDKGYRNKLW